MLIRSRMTSDGKTRNVNSYIYWGASTGYSSTSKLSLPTVGAVNPAVADLNKDGYLDIVFANRLKITSGKPVYEIDSYIYWGSNTGYSISFRTSLPTIGAQDCSIADLNSDGYLDLVFANHRSTTSPTSVYDINSYIYWGSKSGYTVSNRQNLPVLGAESSLVADLNLDGFLDITFPNVGITGNKHSYIYWGGKSGYSSTSRTSLHCLHAEAANAQHSPGTVLNRSTSHSFTSRVMDTGVSSPLYQSLAWKASTPIGTSVKFQTRSGKSATAITSTKWHGPTSTGGFYQKPGPLNTAHNGERYFQYKMILSSDYRNTPILEDATISFY